MNTKLVEPSACRWCGIPKRPHFQQWSPPSKGGPGWHQWVAPLDAQILARMKARRLARTVARVGALPMPAGPVPQGLSPEQERAIRTLDLLALMDDRAAPVVSGHLAVLLGEIDRLRTERHSTNEVLSDAAETLRENARRIAELEALKPAAIQTCGVCGAGYTYGEPCSTCAFRAQMTAELKARGWEDPHDSPLHHSYTTGRDLPSLGGERVRIRWPKGRPPTPFGCRWCGTERGHHGRSWVRGHGLHAWERPTEAQIKARMLARRNARKAVCRCPLDDEYPRPFAPVFDPYMCEASDCHGYTSETSPFGGGPVHGVDAKVFKVCKCGWSTSTWHVDDGSAEEELHRHAVRVHGGAS